MIIAPGHGLSWTQISPATARTTTAARTRSGQCHHRRRRAGVLAAVTSRCQCLGVSQALVGPLEAPSAFEDELDEPVDPDPVNFSLTMFAT